MIGKTVSHYEVTQRLGAGGMGEVFQAEDLKLGRQVALKFLPVDLVGDPQAVKRFLWEARSLSALNHPNICTIYEVDEYDGRPFIAMELLEGRVLNHVINGKALGIDLILALGTQIADGLDAAHRQGLLHRDIKPANIFVTRRNQAKILDFGLAKITHDAQHHAAAGGLGEHPARNLTTTAGITMGTVAYMSPEQARGEELDHRSDLFSFGLVLYEMSTGRQTFTGNTTAVIFDGILNREPVPARQLNPNLPHELERIIGKALDKDRDLRYQSASDLRADLQRLKRELGSGRNAAASRAAEMPEGAAGIAQLSAPVPVAPPATGAAAAAAALDSGPSAPALAATAVLRKDRPRRGVTLLLAGGGAVILLSVAGWFAWRSVQRPVAQPRPEAATAATPAPAAVAPAVTVDPAGAAAGRAAPRALSGSIDGVATAGLAAATPEMERELIAARNKIDARQYDLALIDLRAFLSRHADSSLAPEATMLAGRAQEVTGRRDEAVATYVAFRSRYKSDQRMPEATFRLAQLMGAQKGKEHEVISLCTELITQYPNSARVPEAMFAKAEAEDRLKLREVDPKLSLTVPTSLQTYRALVDRYPKAAASEHALFRIGSTYDDLKRYDLAAQAFERLGTSFPQSPYDGWFRAGEMYERRLNDKEKARAAYLKVPPSSARFKDAQKRAAR